MNSQKNNNLMNNKDDKDDKYTAARKWFDKNQGICCVCDVNWTMERYSYPDYVREWIFNTWEKVNDDNGGTYVKGGYVMS